MKITLKKIDLKCVKCGANFNEWKSPRNPILKKHLLIMPFCAKCQRVFEKMFTKWLKE